jgi:hypothetical protein
MRDISQAPAADRSDVLHPANQRWHIRHDNIGNLWQKRHRAATRILAAAALALGQGLLGGMIPTGRAETIHVDGSAAETLDPLEPESEQIVEFRGAVSDPRGLLDADHAIAAQLRSELFQDGTARKPYRALRTAILRANPNDTIAIRGGPGPRGALYTFKGNTLAFGKAGTVQAEGGLVTIEPLPLWRHVAGDSHPRFNEVSGTATHNSYWFNRDPSPQLLIGDPGASGTQQLLSDQFLHERVRAIEIDVHSEGAPRGEWQVYHTDQPSFSQCNPLSDCLEMLRNFHYAVPLHEVVNVIVELKNTHTPGGGLALGVPTYHNFDSNDHTVEMFDQTFIRVLGRDKLYTPADFLARCPPGESLTQCAENAGWPSVEELRGKFIINIIGNWSQASADWVSYVNAAEAGIVDRAAFPVRSVFDEHGAGQAGWPGNWADTPAPMALRRAHDASIFWQVETPIVWDTYGFIAVEVPRFLLRNGVVRAADAFDFDSQVDRLSRGFEFVQTDYPWHVSYDGPFPGTSVPIDPSRRLFRPTSSSIIQRSAPPARKDLIEPGDRLYVSAEGDTVLFASSAVPTVSHRRWETTVSTTRKGVTWESNPNLRFSRRARDDGMGCLRAGASSADFMEICRLKGSWIVEYQCHGVRVQNAPQNQEWLWLHYRVVRNGATTAQKGFVPDLCQTDRFGNLIALEVENRGSDSVVTAFSAGAIGATAPRWQQVYSEAFPFPMTMQGLVATQDVLFVGSKVESDDAAPRPVTLCDLDSVDTGGGSTSVIVDFSFPGTERCPRSRPAG